MIDARGSGRRLEWIQMEIMECSGGEWEIWVEIMVIQVKDIETEWDNKTMRSG